MLELVAVVVALDGSQAVRATGQSSRSEAASLGRRVATQLIADGAGEILAEARRAGAAIEDSRLSTNGQRRMTNDE
jgi:porphobilinogen deaminase